MKTCLTSASLVFTLFAAACGGSALDPGAGSDPGQGTQTLVVTGSAKASARLTNAHAPGDFSTDFSVHVQLNSQIVSTGKVTMTSRSGVVPLAFQTANNGRWEATAPGYDEVYILDVESGPDNVHGVRVDGPDIHVFTAPTAGASVNSTLVVPIAWDRQDSAQSASIDTDNVDHLSISDTGTFSLPAGSLKAEKDTVRSNTIKIERTNRVTPAGAQGGSELTVSVENEIDVIVQPNPAL
jgi:hypothetical protein